MVQEERVKLVREILHVLIRENHHITIVIKIFPANYIIFHDHGPHFNPPHQMLSEKGILYSCKFLCCVDGEHSEINHYEYRNKLYRPYTLPE